MPYILLLKRCFAQSIDMILFFFCNRVFYEIVNANNPMAYDRLFNGVGELFLFIPIYILYSFVLEWFTRGFSVGKWLLGLRVVKINGGLIGFREVFIRWLGNLFDFYLSCGIGAILSVLLSSSQQRIGDRWAGTVVRRKSGD